jgi:hypothetical protein
MAGKIKVRNKMPQVIDKIKNRSKQFVVAATSIGANWSKQWAPVAYSTLVNSQNITVKVNGETVSGKVGFYVDYAKYLETNENWKPKKPPKYGKAGSGKANAWNANATPHFLQKGFENPEPQREIEAAKKIFRSK